MDNLYWTIGNEIGKGYEIGKMMQNKQKLK